MMTSVPQYPTLVSKKRRSTLPWNMIPIKSGLNGENDSDLCKQWYGKGTFGSLQNEQEEIQLSIDKNQRLLERNLRIKEYGSAAKESNIIEDKYVKSIPLKTTKIVSFLSQQRLENKASLKDKQSKRNKEKMELALLDENKTKENNNTISFSYTLSYGIFLSSFIFLGLFSATTFSAQLAQCYLGIHNYPYTASIMRELAVYYPIKNGDDDFFKTRLEGLKNSKKYEYDLSDQKLSNNDRKVDDDIIFEKIRIEINRLRGCGDALFVSTSTYDLTQNSTEKIHGQKVCPNLMNRNFLSGKEKPKNTIGNNDEKDSKEAVVNSIYYDDFIRNYNYNLIENMRHDSYLSTSILHPRHDSPTVSSILTWEFDGILFKCKTIFGDNASTKIKIFLDVRIDDLKLFFPGGNLISVEISMDSKPVSY